MPHSSFVENPAKNPPLVLLHGWGLNSGVWQATIKHFQDTQEIITIDLPGYGLNREILPKPYTLLTMAQHVLDVLPEQSIILGWSLGGLVAQQIAQLAPRRVQALILLASSAKFCASDEWPGIKANVLSAFQDQLASNINATLSRFLAIQAMGSETAKQDIKAIKGQIDQYPQPHPLALAAGLQILLESDLRHAFSELNMPVHLLLGRLDSLVPVAVKHQLTSLHSSLDVEVFQHSSHAPFISEFALFTHVLQNILVQHSFY
jgi:pimeloyl-[acyl-carrier protein] methyl ester esterase